MVMRSGYRSRKSKSSKCMVKRRRNYRRGVRRPKIHTFIRKEYIEGALYTGTPVGGVSTFNLNDLPNSSEFTSLYDRYKIKKVVLKFIPKVSQTVTQSPGSMSVVANSRGHLFTAIDYDDAVTPTSVDTLLQYPNCKRSSTDRVHTRTIYPMVRGIVYNVADTGAPLGYTTAFAPERRFIDCTTPKVVHYGLKWWLTVTNGLEVTYDIEATYHLQFKNIR